MLKRIQKGPVKGISLKIQEEQREKRLDTIPEKSNIDISKQNVAITKETKDMLESISMYSNLQSFLTVQEK